MDLTVDVSALPPSELTSTGCAEETAVIRCRVEAARTRQMGRAQTAGASINARLAPRALRRVCNLDRKGERLLELALQQLGLTARAFDRVLRVSRTIADLDSADRVAADHVAEALQFRGFG
jgi:magnesium chelatase family protein